VDGMNSLVFAKAKGFLTDTLTYGSSNVLGQFVSFLLLPLYTRYLSPGDYGILALVALFSSMITTVCSVGMANSIFRQFNLKQHKVERETVISCGFWTIITVSTILASGGFYIIDDVAQFMFQGQLKNEGVIITQIVLVTCLISSIGRIPVVVLRAERRVKVAASLNLVGLAITIMLSIVLVVHYRWGVLGVVSGQLGGAVVTCILRFAMIGRFSYWKINPVIWKSMIFYGLPMVPHQLLSIAFMQFNVFVVWSLLGANEAGMFNIATKIAMPLSFLIGAGQEAWVPIKFQIASSESDGKEVFRTIANYYFATILSLWVAISVLGPDIVRVMTASEFHRSRMLVPYVAMIPVMQGAYWMLGSGYGLGTSQRTLPLISLLGLAIVVVCSLGFVPYFGSYGAAVSTCLGLAGMAVYLFRVAQKQFPVQYQWRIIAFSAVLAGVFVALGTGFQNHSVLIRVPIGVALSVVYPTIILVTVSLTSDGGNYIGATLSKLSFWNYKALRLVAFGNNSQKDK